MNLLAKNSTQLELNLGISASILCSGRAISFVWTSEQLLDGVKTCTRRAWTDNYAEYFVKAFHKSQYLPAIDKSYYSGGKRVGALKLTCVPYKEKLADMPVTDLAAEGGMCKTVDQFVEEYFKGNYHLTVWVVRFKFFGLEDLA